MTPMRALSMRGSPASTFSASNVSVRSAQERSCAWSEPVLEMPRGPKLSTMKAATPQPASVLAHLRMLSPAGLSSPPLPCLRIIAGTGLLACAGR